MTRIMSMDDEEIFDWLHEMFDGTIWGPEYPALLFGSAENDHIVQGSRKELLP